MKNKNKIHVSGKDNIADVISKYPYTAEVFLAYGLHCVGCFASAFDTIEQGCDIHGMGKEDVDMLLKDINLVISEGEKQKQKHS